MTAIVNLEHLHACEDSLDSPAPSNVTAVAAAYQRRNKCYLCLSFAILGIVVLQEIKWPSLYI